MLQQKDYAVTIVFCIFRLIAYVWRFGHCLLRSFQSITFDWFAFVDAKASPISVGVLRLWLVRVFAAVRIVCTFHHIYVIFVLGVLRLWLVRFSRQSALFVRFITSM